MKTASDGSKCLLLAVVAVGLVSASSLGAEKKSWEDETVLVSRQGDQTVVRPVKGDKVLFKNKDAQLAIEWALANARTTLVQAGSYMVDDSIDAPRDGVTLIIDQGAVIEMNLDADPKTNIGFRSRLGPNAQQLAPIIYIKNRNNVRVYYFGDLVHGKKKKPAGSKQPFVQTFPVVFDGRNKQRTCGVDGGTLIATGTIHNSFLCLDSKNMKVPLVCPAPSGGDGVFCMEGCDDAAIGMVVNLAGKKGGGCGETVDLNACNSNIKIDTLIGERANEIIDCNASQADIQETISIGRSPTLFDLTPNSGNRWTSRPRATKRLTCKKLTILSGDDPAKVGLVKGRNRKNRLALVVDIGDLKTKEKPPADVEIGEVTFLADAVDVKRTITIPKLPDALPCFTVKATVEVTLKDGGKKLYTKAVEIDVRTGNVKP
ncbi:MAG: hypothetical protein QGH60_17765 [Phycisphaerae bacterium]|nr:hypothetical protein [Phycisphaerae bacterium]